MNETNKSWFAELADNRFITDIGPSCADCGAVDGQGMWVYLLPTDQDWENVAIRWDGKGEQPQQTVQAQCACCHRVECFDVNEAKCDTVQKIRASHSQARVYAGLAQDQNVHPRRVGGVYNITIGR